MSNNSLYLTFLQEIIILGDYPFQGDTIFKLFENIGKGEFR